MSSYYGLHKNSLAKIGSNIEVNRKHPKGRPIQRWPDTHDGDLMASRSQHTKRSDKLSMKEPIPMPKRINIKDEKNYVPFCRFMLLPHLEAIRLKDMIVWWIKCGWRRLLRTSPILANTEHIADICRRSVPQFPPNLYIMCVALAPYLTKIYSRWSIGLLKHSSSLYNFSQS